MYHVYTLEPGEGSSHATYFAARARRRKLQRNGIASQQIVVTKCPFEYCVPCALVERAAKPRLTAERAPDVEQNDQQPDDDSDGRQ